jgi:hypothetical protein
MTEENVTTTAAEESSAESPYRQFAPVITVSNLIESIYMANYLTSFNPGLRSRKKKSDCDSRIAKVLTP